MYAATRAGYRGDCWINWSLPCLQLVVATDHLRSASGFPPGVNSPQKTALPRRAGYPAEYPGVCGIYRQPPRRKLLPAKAFSVCVVYLGAIN
jgi:hypothetical protein